MFTLAAQATSRFLAPIAVDAARATAAVVMVYSGVAAVGGTAYGTYLLGRKAVRYVRSIPRPLVTITWDRNWDKPVAAAPAAQASVEGGTAQAPA
jgi:hypothetical protein